MESMTVFATESGTGSPETRTLQDYLFGDYNVAVITEEQKAEIDTVSKTALEVGEPTFDEETGVTKYVVCAKNDDSSSDESQIQSQIEVTINSEGLYSVTIENGDTTTTLEFTEEEVSKLLQSSSTPEITNISPADGNTSISDMSTAQKVEIVAKSVMVANTFKNNNVNILSTTGADIQGTIGDDGSIDLNAPNIKKGDNVYVLHKVNGVWQPEKSEVLEDGVITLKGLTSLSPFIIFKVDKDVSALTAASAETDYTQPNASLTNGTAGTVSGATSPKTAEAEPYKTVAALAIIAIAAAAVCSRKITNK
jgi:hypothetical protein